MLFSFSMCCHDCSAHRCKNFVWSRCHCSSFATLPATFYGTVVNVCEQVAKCCHDVRLTGAERENPSAFFFPVSYSFCFFCLVRCSFRLFPNFRWDALRGIYSDVTLPYLSGLQLVFQCASTRPSSPTGCCRSLNIVISPDERRSILFYIVM